MDAVGAIRTIWGLSKNAHPETTMKPPAELVIVRTASGATSYRLYHGRALVWSTRAYSTEAGRDGARERLRQWLRVHPYKVVLAQEEVQQERRRA